MPYTQFLGQKIKIFEKKKKAPGYIIILHLYAKNHNHLMYSSLKMMPTALQVILGQSLLFYSIFGMKITIFQKMKKCLKHTKSTKNNNHTKDHITCCSSDRVRTSFCQFWAVFVPLPHFWPKKSKFSQMEKKTPRDIIILHTLRCLIINVWVKINVGVRDFS